MRPEMSALRQHQRSHVTRFRAAFALQQSECNEATEISRAARRARSHEKVEEAGAAGATAVCH
jgi:hypothetical protein